MEIPLLEIKSSVDDRMKSWLQRVRGSLERESKFHGKEVIYPVPMCLKKDETISFYHPKEICFGPQHFRTEAVAYKYGEQVKEEVARNLDAILKNSDAPAEDGGLLLVVKKLEPRIQEIFAKRYLIPDRSLINNDEVIAWLLVRDACFVLEVLDRFSVDEPTEAEKESKHLWQHILNRKNHHPLLNDIVKDMFKLENQLPLWVFQEMFKLENLSPLWVSLKRGKAGNWFEPALKNLSPVEVTHISSPSRTYGKKIHILQLLGEYMVDNRAEHSKSSSTSSKDDGNHHSGAKHSTSTSSKEDAGNHDKAADEESGTCDAAGVHREETDEKEDSLITYLLTLMLYVLLFLVLLPVLIVCFLMLFIFRTWEKDQKNERHVPTIEELDKIGVKFKRLKSKGISHIKFRDSKLYLPKFTVDDRSEVILRNLLVMETHWEDAEKVMTRYVVFMNDLVNTCEDVSRLRKEGIIVNNLRSNEDVARMWNSVSIPATDIPSSEPIDSVCEKINAHRKKGWRVLWAQFWRLYCSKPWLLASLLGGICLLLLTAVQVFCLFYQCQSGSSNKPGF